MGLPRSFLKDKITEAGAAAIWNRLTNYVAGTVTAFLKGAGNIAGYMLQLYFWWRVLKCESSGGN